MNFKKLGTALFAGLLLASPLATVSAQDTVKVGGNFELSGAAAAYGTPMANGLLSNTMKKTAALTARKSKRKSKTTSLIRQKQPLLQPN